MYADTIPTTTGRSMLMRLASSARIAPENSGQAAYSVTGVVTIRLTMRR